MKASCFRKINPIQILVILSITLFLFIDSNKGGLVPAVQAIKINQYESIDLQAHQQWQEKMANDEELIQLKSNVEALQKQKHQQKFLGTWLMKLGDIITFGLLEKPQKKKNKPQQANHTQQANNTETNKDSPKPAPVTKAEVKQMSSSVQTIHAQQTTAQQSNEGDNNNQPQQEPQPQPQQEEPQPQPEEEPRETLLSILRAKAVKHSNAIDKQFVQSVFDSYSIKSDQLADDEEDIDRVISRSNALQAIFEVFQTWNVDLIEAQRDKFVKEYFKYAWDMFSDDGYVLLTDSYRMVKQAMTMPQIKNEAAEPPKTKLKTADVISNIGGMSSAATDLLNNIGDLSKIGTPGQVYS